MPALVPIVDGRRRCPRCRDDVLLEQFSSYTRKGKTVYTWCKECNRKYARGRPATARALGLIAQKRVLVEEIKKGPCADCENRFPSPAMDLDHVRGDKTTDISKMVGQSYSMEALVEELTKCELVCANCHRIRTAERGRSREARLAISRSRGGRPFMDETGRVYQTLREASDLLEVHLSSIGSVLAGKLANTGGHTFSYVA